MSNRTISQRVRRTAGDLGTERDRDLRDVEAYPVKGYQGDARRLLVDIRELSPAIAARTAEFEAERRIPVDVVDVLKGIGAFRLFVPRNHGGLELDLPSGLAIITALARLDGSVGWTAMIGNTAHLFASLLPRPTYEQLYANGPDVMVAGVSSPRGRPRRPTAAGGSMDAGRSPAGASMPTGWPASA